jgi:hypothetical protein
MEDRMAQGRRYIYLQYFKLFANYFGIPGRYYFHQWRVGPSDDTLLAEQKR